MSGLRFSESGDFTTLEYVTTHYDVNVKKAHHGTDWSLGQGLSKIPQLFLTVERLDVYELEDAFEKKKNTTIFSIYQC